MGRSVSYLSNAEYVIYFNADWLNGIDENGEYNEDEAQWNWEDFKTNLVYEIKNKLKSYDDVEKWDCNEVMIFLENQLCEIGISEYCGLYSLSIRIKEEEFYTGQIKDGLAGNHAFQIRKTLEKCLINCGVNLLNKIGTFSNGNSVYELAK